MGISHRVIEKLGNEPFNSVVEGELTHGDDVSFCHRAREAGFKIFADSDIRIGHIKTRIIKIGDEIN